MNGQVRSKLQKLHPLKGVSLTLRAYHTSGIRLPFLTWTFFIGGGALFLQFFPSFLIIAHGYTTGGVGPLLAFMGGGVCLYPSVYLTSGLQANR